MFFIGKTSELSEWVAHGMKLSYVGGNPAASLFGWSIAHFSKHNER